MKGKITWLDYSYILLLLIYTGSATIFARSLGNIATFGSWVGIFATCIMMYCRHIRLDRQYFYVIGIFLCYAAITTINNGIINLMWITQIILYLSIAYVLVRIYDLYFFVIYEKLIYWLCIVSLIFWSVELIAPNLVLSIVSALSFSAPYADGGNVAANMGVYTVGNPDFASEFQWLLRNSGFAWEPGAFAVMICLAIYCNAIRTKFSLKKNKQLYIMLLALLSTQSTTGMMLLCILIIGYIMSQRALVAGISLCCAIPLLYFIYSAPYVKDKIMDEYTNIDIETRIQYISEASSENTAALGRMESFIIEWNEFKRHPFIGLGGWSEGSYLQQQGVDIATVSGLGSLLSKYGLFISLLFFISLIKTTAYIMKQSHCRGVIVFPLLFVGLMISYNLWIHAIIIPFWIYIAYRKKDSTVLL